MEELEKEILNTFKKVEINIPLLDVVRQIPNTLSFSKNYVHIKGVLWTKR